MTVIETRKSIRKYKPDVIPEEKLRYVLEAARLAPSWANRQCWNYIIVTDEALKQAIATREWVAQAPVIIVGCADPAQSGDKHEQAYYMLDMGISMEHLILAAADIGLGTCWIGGQFDEAKVKAALQIPESIRVVALTPLGYPDETPSSKPRNSFSEITRYNRW